MNIVKFLILVGFKYSVNSQYRLSFICYFPFLINGSMNQGWSDFLHWDQNMATMCNVWYTYIICGFILIFNCYFSLLQSGNMNTLKKELLIII